MLENSSIICYKNHYIVFTNQFKGLLAFSLVQVCVSMCGYVHSSAGGFGCQRNWKPVELELQVVMNHQMLGPGTESGLSARAVHALNCWVLSLSSEGLIFIYYLLKKRRMSVKTVAVLHYTIVHLCCPHPRPRVIILLRGKTANAFF